MRQGTAAQWTALNPTLANSEVGLETDTGLKKVGNGSTAWNSLSYNSTRTSPRVVTTTSSATPTINTDVTDVYGLTAQGTTNITSLTTNLSGTPVDGDRLLIYIVTSGAITISHGSGFEAGPVALPTAISGAGRLDTLYTRNAATSKWRCMASGFA